MHHIKELLSDGVRVLIWSGNNDLVCSYSSTRYWIYGRLNESDTGKSVTNWTSWHVGGDVGGWYEEWKRFAFMVVRDAGHEVPEYQPVRAYSLFQRFLNWNYNDTPIAVPHTEWMYVNGEDDGVNNRQKMVYIAIGVGIGIGICVLMKLISFGCAMVLGKHRLKKEQKELSRSMIQ